MVYYNELLSERTDGYKDYMSIYTNLFGFDILYEYKDYSTEMLYNTFSNPPVVFKEPSSALIGRNLHTIDFSNEYGHQIDINKIFDNDLTLLISYAFALHHRQGYDDKNIFNFNIYDDISLLNNLFPYEQYFIEFSNWSKSRKVYYRIGYDYYYESTYEKTIEAKTIPTQFAYKFKKGNSLTIYFEVQNKFDDLLSKEYDYFYLSPSYNHFGKWSLTFFSDIDKKSQNTYAIDYTVNMQNNSQLSLFFGSQKGGLVCANGSCVQQPDFEDGLKVTLRSNKMYEFIDRLVNIALPRIKDFQGLSANGFDNFGNYSFGIKEHIIFPEINFDKVDRIRGMDITIVTNGKKKEITKALLEAANFPFIKKDKEEKIN